MKQLFNTPIHSLFLATTLAVGSLLTTAPALGSEFSPPERGAPDSTADGGSRGVQPVLFDPPDREAPEGGSVDGAGTRGVMFAPPERGAPDTTADGGTRRDHTAHTYLPSSPQLLLPGGSLPMTLDAHPSFFAYIPDVPAAGLKFTLYRHDLSTGADDQRIYEVEKSMPSRSGIVEFVLPTDAQYALEAGQMYHWYVSIILDPQDPSSNWVADGWVERQASNSRAAQSVATRSVDQPAWQVYAQAGLWHEALAAHLKNRDVTAAISPETCASDAGVSNWGRFLNSVNLCEVVAAPVVN